MFIELRRFNRAVDSTPYRGKTVYIDALDEARSLTKGDQTSVDKLVSQLEEHQRHT